MGTSSIILRVLSLPRLWGAEETVGFPLIFLPEYESFRDEVNKQLAYHAFWDWILFDFASSLIDLASL